MQISGWPLSVFIPIFIHKNILTKASDDDKQRRTTMWTTTTSPISSAAAHWWIRWGEVWPARCRSLRMMQPGTSTPDGLIRPSPSTSMRQYWSVELHNVVKKKKKYIYIYSKELLLRTQWSLVVIRFCDLGAWTALKEWSKQSSQWLREQMHRHSMSPF